MTAFQVYLILQLDTIKVAMGVPIAISAVFAIAGTIMYFCSLDNLKPHIDYETDADSEARIEEAKRWNSTSKKMLSFFVPVFVLFVCATTLLPSTKTAAAVVLIPALTQNEELNSDLGEIYNLGIQRIKELLGSEVTPECGERGK